MKAQLELDMRVLNTNIILALKALLWHYYIYLKNL